MSEKRFYLLNYNNYPIYDSLNDKEYNAQFKAQREKLCLLLNELADENQYLKSLKWNQDCINEISISMQQIQLLKKENEQLKKEIVLLQNRLHNCNMKSRKIAITEMKDAIKKMERYE